MPKVSTYGGSQVTSQLAQGQRLREVPVADTSAIARGLGQGINNFAVEKKKVDTTAAEESLVNFEREKNDLFFNPETGYFNKQGRNAYDGAEDANKQLTKLQNKYSDELTSEDARAAFKRASDVYVTRGMNDIGKHSTTGLQAYEAATMKARVENSVETIGLYWNSDEDVEIQRQVGRSSVIDMAEQQGLGSEATNELLQNYESQATRARITAAMTTSVTEGKALFDKYEDRLEPQDKMPLKQNIDKAIFDMDSQNAAQSIAVPGKTLSQLMDEVAGMPSTTPEEVKLKTEVGRLVKNQYTLNKQLEAERKDAIYQDWGKQVLAGDITTREIPGEVWENLTVSQLSNLKRVEAAIAKGTPRVTDMTVYTKLMTMDDKSKANLDPMDYYNQLDDGDFKKLVTQVDQAKNGKTSDPSYTNVVTDSARMANLSRQLYGKTVAKLNSNETESYNALTRTVQQRITIEEQDKGKKLTPPEKDKIYQEFAREHVIEKPWYVGGDQETQISDLDPQVVDYVTRILADNNMPINSINIINFVRDPQNIDIIKSDLGDDIDI